MTKLKAAYKDYLVFGAVLLVTLLSCAGIALPYPILAPLFMDGVSNGLNSFMGYSPEWLLGVALAIYPLGIFIGGSFIGALSDVYGRKKVLIHTLLISIIGYLITAWAIVTESYLLFIAARFFTGLCEGNVSIARAIALDLGESIDKTRAMSLISASTFLGWLIGPLAGGYLAEYGPEVAFEAGAIAIVFCMLFVMLVVKETHKVETNESLLTLVKSHNSLHLLKIPGVRAIFYFQLMFTLGLNAFYEFYPVWLVVARDYTPGGIGETTAIMTITMTLTSLLLVTKLKRIFGMKSSLITGMLICVVAMGILPMTQDGMMITLFALTGIGIAIYNGLLPVYASEANPDVGNGSLMGLLTVTFCIANTIIALIGSQALKFGADVPLLLGSALVLVSSLMLARYLFSNQVLTAKSNPA